MDRERIIKALECCSTPGVPKCKECPYEPNCTDDRLCDLAMYQILVLLKEKESKWITEGHKKDRFCKLCGHDEPYKNAEEGTKIFNYCPHCGAKMTN